MGMTLPGTINISDNVKMIPLSGVTSDVASAWGWTQGDELGVYGAYAAVPWLYRAIDIRAKAIAALPYALYHVRGDEDLSTDPAYTDRLRKLRKLLYPTEGALCLYGVSYWIHEANRFGKNQQLRWLLPTSITCKYDEAAGVTGYTRQLKNRTIDLTPEQLIAFWVPNLAGETGPGLAPAQVALRASNLLYHQDEAATNFFRRGMIKATLLTIEGNPPPGEIDKLERWWKRLITGVKNAYQSIALRAAVKPVIIGEGMKDLENSELTAQSIKAILTSLGVPHSLALSDAANHATAYQDSLNFYEQTIKPEAELILAPLNDYLAKEGLRLDVAWNKLEVYQQQQLAQAQAIGSLVGQPILSINEGRELLGYGPMPEPETTAVSCPSCGADAPENAAYCPSCGAPMAPDITEEVIPAEEGASEETVLLSGALKAWERKALKRAKAGRDAACEFDSDVVPVELAEDVYAGLKGLRDVASVRHLFEHIKAAPALTDDEEALRDALLTVLEKYGIDLAKRLASGAELDLTAFSAELRAALVPALTAHALDEGLRLAVELGPEVDPATLQSTAAEWARSYGFERVTQLTEATQKVLQQAVSAYQETPGMTRDQLVKLLRPAFGLVRADIIAITEITRAANQATLMYQRHLGEAGITMERVWRTNADERVCPVCGPLNGKAEASWAERFPNGAPAHPRCRCATTLRAKR